METEEKCHLTVLHPNRAFQSFRVNFFFSSVLLFPWDFESLPQACLICQIKCMTESDKKNWTQLTKLSYFLRKLLSCGNLAKGKTSGLNPHQIFQFCLKMHWLRHEYRSKDTHWSCPKDKASMYVVLILRLIFEQKLPWDCLKSSQRT